MNYDFIEAVLHRPKMDTLTGSYFEVIAFLEGYYSGLVKSTNEMNESAKWSYFKQWLTKELDSSTENPFGLLYEKDQTKDPRGTWSDYHPSTIGTCARPAAMGTLSFIGPVYALLVSLRESTTG